ncbi:hypothetical protein PG990_005874 [Apiospora arundinis]|uniref:Chitin-binding type-1 domain-containing protein n=1 Tax=Apiospora arundinis TaxID=335852 RepID=A0ABR2J935_9PEZI
MHFLAAIVIMGSLAAAMEKYMPLPNATLYQRQLISCEQTYGTGALNCGGESSRFCFKPNIGQTCCPDSGYCDKGFYCAPVAKYCCAEGEDLATCARNAGFVLPASLACSTAKYANTSPASATSVAQFMPPTSTSITPNFDVVTTSGVAGVQALGDGSTTFLSLTGNLGFTVASVAANAGTFVAPSATAVFNDTTPPYVQVSAAGKHGMTRSGISAAVWVAVAWVALVGLRITA